MKGKVRNSRSKCVLSREKKLELGLTRVIGTTLIVLGVSLAIYQSLLILPLLPKYGKYLYIRYEPSGGIIPYLPNINRGVMELYGMTYVLEVYLFIVVGGLLVLLEYYTYRIKYCIGTVD